MILNFYNHFHNGDIHQSREFVKDMIKKLNYDKFNYFHKNDISILKDIKEINQINSDLKFLDYEDSIFYYDNNIYVNTWVGQKSFHFLKMRRSSLYSYYELFKDIYTRLNLKLEKIDYYVPVINFDNIDKTNVDNFVLNNKNKKILICNGDTLSGQSVNFSFDNIVENASNLYKDVLFILTKRTNILKNNVIYTEDVTKLQYDLIEISYLSTFCDIIIGRDSGPHAFTYIRDNCYNKHKKNISISSVEDNSIWFSEFTWNNIWFNDYDENHIQDMIIKEINKTL